MEAANFDYSHSVAKVENVLPSEMWAMIFSYLPYRDLQQVRLVCKTWADVSNTRKFRNKSKLRIAKRNVLDIKAYLANEASVDDHISLQYECLQLEYLRYSDVELVLHRIGPQVRYFAFRDTWIFALSLQTLLPNLETLEPQCTFLGSCGILEFINLSGLKKLKFLNLASCGLPLVQHVLLQQAANSSAGFQLQQLHVVIGLGQENLVLDVLEMHAATLRHITLDYSVSVMHDMGKWQLVCQQLEHLQTIELTGIPPAGWIRTVFQCLPATLPLKHIRITRVPHSDDALFTTIISKWWWTLEQLEFKSCHTFSNEGMATLKILRQLRSLKLSNTRQITTLVLVEGIACELNTCLRELELNDIGNLDEECICLLAERLPYLESLSLGNCRRSVTDTALAHIFHHQIRLRTLNLSRCTLISDVGLIGMTGELCSIRRLRGLRTLRLSGCNLITDESLIHGFNFDELQTLEFAYFPKISANGIGKLVRNCPAIEYLTISVCHNVDDRSIRHIAKNMKRLRCMELNNKGLSPYY